MDRLPIVGGEYLILEGDARALRTFVGYLLLKGERQASIGCDLEGSITQGASAELISQKWGKKQGDSIFGRDNISLSAFDWPIDVEIGLITSLIEPFRGGIGLDVGCGYGRLALPLLDMGYNIDGVDSSLPAIQWIQGRNRAGRGRFFCCDIADFCAPSSYDYAISAMNSLRYLPSHFAFARHLRLAGLSLKSGSPYLVNITLGEPRMLNVVDHVRPAKSWTFQSSKGSFRAKWCLQQVDFQMRTCIDEVTIEDTESRDIVYLERQRQLMLDLDSFSAAVRTSGMFDIALMFNGAGHPIASLPDSIANVWIVLARKEGQTGAEVGLK